MEVHCIILMRGERGRLARFRWRLADGFMNNTSVSPTIANFINFSPSLRSCKTTNLGNTIGDPSDPQMSAVANRLISRHAAAWGHRMWLGKLSICIIEKRFALPPDDADVQMAEPLFDVWGKPRWKKDCFVWLPEFLLPLKGVIQKLAHGHPDVFSTCRGFGLDQVFTPLLVSIAPQFPKTCQRKFAVLLLQPAPITF